MIDSNICIYAVKPDDQHTYQFLSSLDSFSYAGVTRIEVLGYHRITENEKAELEDLFAIGTKIRLSDVIETKAIELRQQYNMGLGDSIVGSTAIIHNLTLVTRNVRDFQRVPALHIVNPYSID